MSYGVFRRRPTDRRRRPFPFTAATGDKTVVLGDAVDAIAAVPPVAVKGSNASVILDDAVDAIGGVPAVTVTGGTGKTVALTDAVDAVASVPAVSLAGGVTVTLTAAVAAVASVPPVTLSEISVDSIDAPAIVGPEAIYEGTGNLDVNTIPAPGTPIGPLWLASDDSNPYTPTITVRLFESDAVTEVANALDNAFDVTWLDELNGTGYGTLRLPLVDETGGTEPGVAELTPHRMVKCYIGGVEAYTWQIEQAPSRSEVQRGEEAVQVASARGRGWASVLDHAVVYPSIPVLESAPDLDSPFRGLDRTFSFASPDYPNDNWDNAVKQYEYNEAQTYRLQTVETSEGVFEDLPAPVGIPYPNSEIYGNLLVPHEQQAFWIWPDDNAYQEGWAFFRGILVNPPLRPFTISTTADNLFTLFVDGVPVLGENEDVLMWQGWKEASVNLDDSRYYMFGCAVKNTPGGSINPGGWLMASYYPDAAGAPEDWALTSNHLWTATFSADTWPGWTSGQIVNQLITETLNRSGWNIPFVTDFASWTDTDGNPWTITVDGVETDEIPMFSVRVGSGVLDAVSKLHEEGWVDWRMGGGGYLLQMWSADAPSRDSGATYTAGTGGNIVDLEREHDRPLANVLLTSWTGGMTEVIDAASVSSAGRHEDILNTSVSTEAEAIRLAGVELAFRAQNSEGGAISMSIEPIDDTDTPYVAFLPGDSVTIPSLTGGTALVRVMSILVEQDEMGDPIFTLELNRKLPVRARDTNRLLREIGGKTLGAVGTRGHT